MFCEKYYQIASDNTVVMYRKVCEKKVDKHFA